MTKQKIAIFDIDGTIFRSWLFREVLVELTQQPDFPDEIRDQFDFAEHEHRWRSRQSEDSFGKYNDQMVQTFLDHAHLIKADNFDQACIDTVDKAGEYCYVYTRELAKRLKQNGYFLLLISGSFDTAIKHFAKKHGFDEAIGATFVRKDNHMTSELAQITFRDKDQILLNWLDTNRFTLESSYGVGDTMGDAELLDLVDHPIAMNPERELAELARTKGWQIIIERKNLITKLQADANGNLTAEII